jgi:predicted secreted protein
MTLPSILAIYLLFFIGTAFILLPIGVKTDEELGNPMVPGQAESAPTGFNLPKHLGISAIVAAALFGLYYANWTYGWITPDHLDFYHRIFD